MRYIWLAVVIIVIGYTVINGVSAVSTVKSAAQASQMADEASATYLALIALTLAFWFCRKPAEPTPPPVWPRSAPTTDPTPVRAFLDQQRNKPLFAPLPDEPADKP